MQVVRDASWNVLLNDAVKMYRLITPDEKCYKLADATWKCRKKYEELKQQKEGSKIVFLDKLPESNNREKQLYQSLCRAVTMAGKPCSFKTVCGDYCRKHYKAPNAIDMIDVTKQLSKIKINI